jgi:hypothetical protein
MPKVTVLGGHTSSQRDSWWYLVQDENGQLFVKYENDDDYSGDWEKPIAEVLANGPSTAKTLLQERIGRMFEDKDAKGA